MSNASNGHTSSRGEEARSRRNRGRASSTEKPGSGKSTEIVARAEAAAGPRTAVVTYARDAAQVIRDRAPGLIAGTVYSLSWPFVREFAPKAAGRSARFTRSYKGRRIKNEYDPALFEYAEDAPSRRARTESDDSTAELHAWNGEGAPPFDLKAAPPTGALAWVLPLARWLATGRRADLYETLFVDEAQDISPLELAVVLRMVAPGGRLICYGDPGQAIYTKTREAKEPAVWGLPGARRLKEGGHRVGQPLADVAARVLRPIWNRPGAAFASPHPTPLIAWEPGAHPPAGGLVLGYSRYAVGKIFRTWALRGVAVVPAAADPGELVICTGHAAKGAEADDVYLLPWSRSALEQLDSGDPARIRLLYVMLTRARRRLFAHWTLLARIGGL